jgi:uncharacterized membrane protein
VKYNLGYMKRWLSAHRRERVDRAALVAFAILLFWFLGNVVSPYLAPAGTIDLGNEGVVGGSEHVDQIAQIHNGFARFFYRAGDANCHQHADRSFFLHGNQMPFCARCTSIFLGMAIGAAILMFLDLELHIFWILLGLVPMAIDGGFQLLSKTYESTNLLRFVTGSLAGLVTGIALGYIVSELGKMFVLKRKFRKGSG